MTINNEKLESFKKELQARKAALVKGRAETNAEFIDDENSYADSIDQASADADKTLTLQIKHREAAILIDINDALNRMEAGGFGECESCGEDISFARLNANPATTMCLECKAELENERGRFSQQA